MLLPLNLLLAIVLVAAGPLPSPSSSSAAEVTVTSVADLPGTQSAIAIAFDGDLMFVSQVDGITSWNISNPRSPELLGVLPQYIWENEDMDIDPVRDLLFISRDPRGFATPAVSQFPFGAIQVIDYTNPRLMIQVGMTTLPGGHTSTCINDCQWMWTGGPAPAIDSPSDWGGRPIFATDMTDPTNPIVCETPVDTGRNDGQTDYAHDVQVDPTGVAWVSGAGGVRGYWTAGEHFDPVLGEVRIATPCDPVPYGGGGTPDTATPGRFMHNSYRPADAVIPGDDDSRGMILYATEEDTSTDCATSGRFATYDVRSSLDGQDWIANQDGGGFRMDVLDTWTPEGAEGAQGCASAHYFQDRGDGLLAYSFYGEGVRFLDVSDPRDIRQVGYHRPDGSNSWAAYWRQIDGEWFVFNADLALGVQVLAFDDGGAAPSSLPTVPLAGLSAAAAVPFLMDPTTGYLCPLPTLA